MKIFKFKHLVFNQGARRNDAQGLFLRVGNIPTPDKTLSTHSQVGDCTIRQCTIMNLTRDEKKAAVITTLSKSAKKVFRHFNHFSISTNAEQNLLHTVLNWSYILTRLSKSLLSGIFKSWRDHHNIPYFYVHILYQFVGFIHYKDGINKRRRIKRSFIVEIGFSLLR